MRTIRRATILLLTVILLAGGCSSWGGKINNTEGVSYYSKGQYDQALSAFQTAARLNPDDPEVYYNIASTYQQQALRYQDPSLLTQAETNYQICLQKGPTNETTVCCYRGLATVLTQKKQDDLALKTLKEWEEKDPTSIEPKLEIAYLLEAQGKNEEAADALTKIKEWAPTDYRAFYKLGIVKEKQGDDAGALEELRTALRLNPTNEEISNKITAIEGKSAPSVSDSIPSEMPEEKTTPKTGATWTTPASEAETASEQNTSSITFKSQSQPELTSEGFTPVPDPNEPTFNAPSPESPSASTGENPVPQSDPLDADLLDTLPSYNTPTEGTIPASTPEPMPAESKPAESKPAENSASDTLDSLFQEDPVSSGVKSTSSAFEPLTLTQKPIQKETQNVKPLNLPDGTGSTTYKLAYAGTASKTSETAAATNQSTAAPIPSVRKSRVGVDNPGPPRTSVGVPF